MTNGGVQPNDKLIEVLEQAYNLPCYEPVIKVSNQKSIIRLPLACTANHSRTTVHW